jgi:hypothetical protein
MLRTIFKKVVWVGRASSTVFGLALVLALIFGLATAAFGTNGDFFKLGKSNTASAVSKLIKQGAGPALALKVDSGAPLKVNSETKVDKLNADKVDGLDSTELQGAKAYAHINSDGTLDASQSKNVNRSERTVTGVYCVNSTVTPRNVVATIDWNSGTGEITTFANNGLPVCEASTTDNNILVNTATSTGANANKAFYIVIN